MKKYLNKISFIAAMAIIFFSACKKQETNIYYKGGTAPVLSASLKDTIPLVAVDSTSNIISFSWTNPNYQFTDGISSQNVNYYLEFDTLGANFSNPKLQLVSVGGSALDTTLTVGSINTILADGLQLNLGQQHNIQVRVESFLGTGAAALYSAPINFNVTPYAPPALIPPPTTGTLFIVGSAVGSWDNPITQSVLAQQFTQVSPTEYTITTTLIGGDEYKWIAKDGSWDEQFSVATTDDPTKIYGGSFTNQNPQNALAPPTTGTYVIDVNFQTGKFTVTLQ